MAQAPFNQDDPGAALLDEALELRAGRRGHGGPAGTAGGRSGHQIDGDRPAPAKRAQAFEAAYMRAQQKAPFLAFELLNQQRFAMQPNVEQRPSVRKEINAIERDRRKGVEMHEYISQRHPSSRHARQVVARCGTRTAPENQKIEGYRNKNQACNTPSKKQCDPHEDTDRENIRTLCAFQPVPAHAPSVRPRAGTHRAQKLRRTYRQFVEIVPPAKSR